MSLYYETAPFLNVTSSSGSLKSRISNAESTKCPFNQIFALASETSKWSAILSEVIERAELLQHARKLTPNLALLLVHDLLLNKRGISAPSNHPLRLSVEKHKARLAAELTRSRLKRGFQSLEELRADVERLVKHKSQTKEDKGLRDCAAVPKEWPQPRWVRVNTLKTTLQDQLKSTFSDYTVTESLDEILSSESLRNISKAIHVDTHISNVLALPPGTDLLKSKAYLEGHIILQDKASCFPAYLLDVDAEDQCLDACAAPGNKTSHLSAILHQKRSANPSQCSLIHASERDPSRISVLEKMIRKAGASGKVKIHHQDFLKFDINQSPCNKVTAILLDPSCSGSGIVGRDENISVTLPQIQAVTPLQGGKGKKRKRNKIEDPAPIKVQEPEEEEPASSNKEERPLPERLAALSEFQIRLLTRAFRFPKARKITYSTCSIYAAENENVVIQALLKSRNEGLRWRILLRQEQVEGMKAWDVRGDASACREMLSKSDLNGDEVAEACIRCEKGTKEGTQGFFVAAFVRDELPSTVEDRVEDDVWEGFDDT